MAVVSVRTNEEETLLFKSYAKLHGISISEAYKRALMEKIEDEFDAQEMETALERYHKNPKTYSFEEVLKAYDL